MVRSVVITLAQHLQVGRNLLFTLDVIGVTEEFAALLLEDGFGITFDGQVAIFNLLHGLNGLTNFIEQALPADVCGE